MVKALVTGVAGFIGSTLAESLLADPDTTVIGIDSFTDYYAPALKTANIEAILKNPRFALLRADLNELELKEVVRDCDYIYHQAGQPGVRKSWGREFDAYVSANISATQRLLEAATGATNLRRFVYASSSSVYGNAERYPTSESLRPQPVSPYGVSKLAGEHLVSLYSTNFGVRGTSLRYFTVYGPRQRPDMAFTRFLTAACRGEVITVYGTGEQLRDFTFVDDIVAANIRAAQVESDPGSVYNVSGGSTTSVNEVLGLIEGFLGRKIVADRVAPVVGDVFQTGGDSEKITSELGWLPTVPLEEGLKRQLDWVGSVHTSR